MGGVIWLNGHTGTPLHYVSLICLSPLFLGGDRSSASVLLLTVRLQTPGACRCSVTYVSGPCEMCQEMFPVCVLWLSGAGYRK